MPRGGGDILISKSYVAQSCVSYVTNSLFGLMSGALSRVMSRKFDAFKAMTGKHIVVPFQFVKSPYSTDDLYIYVY